MVEKDFGPYQQVHGLRHTRVQVARVGVARDSGRRGRWPVRCLLRFELFGRFSHIVEVRGVEPRSAKPSAPASPSAVVSELRQQEL